jgi:hypothetical protein
LIIPVVQANSSQNWVYNRSIWQSHVVISDCRKTNFGWLFDGCSTTLLSTEYMLSRLTEKLALRISINFLTQAARQLSELK